MAIMAVNKCRVCGNKFFEKPLLLQKNMPRRAQFLPAAEEIKSDKGIDLKVCQCSGCGLVQLDGNPVSYHKEVIRASSVSEEMKSFREKQLSDFIRKFSLENKKVIEFGCGCGEYLSIIKEAGADAYGLEYSEKSIKQCKKMKLKVVKGFIKDKLKDAPFDAFLILSFLEHLPKPNLVLKSIYNNLADGAVGIVEVPNLNMILEKKLFSEFMTDHLFYFTKNTLKTLLEWNGFEVVDCKKIWHEYIISAIVRKRRKLNLASFKNQQDKINKEIKEYIDGFGDKRVAVWSAGHQALAIISLMSLSNKLKYVIDSAKFKQGRYTPVTHVPIVSPDTINLNPIDAIIIIAGSYSDEVAGIIREKYNKNIKVSILRDFGLEKV